MNDHTQYSSTIGDELVGKGVKALYVGELNELLVFETVDGDLIGYRVQGDCCSTSWFNDVTGVRDLIGHNVTNVELIDAPTPSDDDLAAADCLQVYGTRLTTETGTVDIVFRNESNGYYGGWADYADVMDVDGLDPITSDWVAVW